MNASSRTKQRWKRLVAAAASSVFAAPLDGYDLKIKIRFFYESLPDFDTDNISKPICDALKGIAYRDDNQLMRRDVGRIDLNGSYRLENVDPGLAVAMAEGEEFVAIRMERVDGGVIDI
jgi:crossover junction endodeoxyribonuclease RusA